MSISLFEEEVKITYTYSEIAEMLNRIECPVNKFLTEVKKIIKLKKSSPLWYGFSDSLLEQYHCLNNKDQHARIKGESAATRKSESYNFRCCPQSPNYYNYHCLNIEVENGIVKVVGSFLESV